VIFAVKTLGLSNKKVLTIVFSLIFILVIFFIYFLNQPLHSEIYSMNTVIDLDVWGINRYQVVREIEKEINYLNSLFDDFNPNSEVSKINLNAGVSEVKVSKDTLDIIKKGKDAYYLTNGSFNIMIAPILKLWGFKTGDYRIPSASEIEKTLPLTNIDDLVINEDSVYLKKPNEAIDLGGIAKGYALDKVKSILEKNKVKKAVINMGGNVFVYSSVSNQTFNIGIKHPRENSVIAVIKVKSGTFIATSGDYERYFEENGKRYCHIFDPKTGYPVTLLSSATAITKEGYLGDVLSTAFFVLGKENALKLADKLGVDAVLIDQSLNISYTKGISEVISVENR